MRNPGERLGKPIIEKGASSHQIRSVEYPSITVGIIIGRSARESTNVIQRYFLLTRIQTSGNPAITSTTETIMAMMIDKKIDETDLSSISGFDKTS